MNSKEIRNKFLKYFEKNGHKILPGSPLIPKDKSVLLTVAGMLQFKPIFLGLEKPQYKRAATIQKCIRTNDIENVGKTTRHHTFFEMLGNFSFGDYFKKEAIAFAWGLITNEFNLNKNKLYFAVYEKDDESYNIWKNEIGISEDRLFRLGEDNNFWAAGPTGPCGPCSEIYYDLGEKYGCGNTNCSPGCDCDRFLEIWNLVFMEFNRDEKGILSPLPNKNIDTGMGLERIASVLQGKASNFETDLFMPIIKKIEEIPGVQNKGCNQISFNVIADHVRAASFLMQDGIIPGNEGRNYVLRRIIRRAYIHGTKIGINDPFLYKLSNIVFEISNEFYPVSDIERAEISNNIKHEEENFIKTLDAGLNILNGILSSSSGKISGADAFKLYDTYGFPIELTKEIAAEKGIETDLERFRIELEKQKGRSREMSTKSFAVHAIPQISGYPKTEFIGYETLETEAKVLGIEGADNDFIILDKSPFYVESGGQISDKGHLFIERNKFEVIHLAKTKDGVILHQIDRLLNDQIFPLSIRETIRAHVDKNHRNMTAVHHSSTHLLHAALRQVIGEGAVQKGSFVSSDRFRFDFISNKALLPKELDSIEQTVNNKIKEAVDVETLIVPVDEAKKMGAMALFEEKYENTARVVKIGNFSLELCGGTHVKNTSQIGLFKIIKEGAVSSGVRRIEARCGSSAQEYIKEEALKKENEEQLILKKEMGKGLEKEQEKIALEKTMDAVSNAFVINGIKIINLEFDKFSAFSLKRAAQDAKEKIHSCIVIFISKSEDAFSLVIGVSNDILKNGFHAGNIIKELSKSFKIKGGGKADIAQGGGSDLEKVNDIFGKMREIVKRLNI